MAIYEYYCGDCGKEFELMRPISRANEPGPCPICEVDGQKLMSATASKVDYYIRTPSKPAFRQHPPAKKPAAK